jgi:hypothetical protein
MPDFAESLQGKDLGHLNILAQLWGVKVVEQEAQLAILQLRNTLLNDVSITGMLTSLGPELKKALDDLSQHAGRLPWAQFSRCYGEIREMGPARRDRERPYETPISIAEALWYRGLIARAFFDTSTGAEEFAYIPDDLLALLPKPAEPVSPLMGRSASAEEYAHLHPADSCILDHACTFLAGIRSGVTLPDKFYSPTGEELTIEIMQAFSTAAGLLDASGKLLSEPVRQFLELERNEALRLLFQAWRQSDSFNELRLLPELTLEGKRENDPQHTRQAILGWISKVPQGTWWNLDSFISAIKQSSPDFQRPAGDYDSWFIKDRRSGEFLRGFEHWNRVDGRVIRFVVCGPLYWLGVLDLACPEVGQPVTAFRLSAWSKALVKGEPPKGLPQEKEALLARSDAHLSAKRLFPRRLRYQVARFCEWEKETPDAYLYRITPQSLRRAKQQGLTVSQLIGVLNRYAKAVPPSLLKALERWDKEGSEARLEKNIVLRVSSGEVLQALRKSGAGRFLGEPLGPAAVVIKPGATDKVLSALAELGYLGEIRGEEQ